MTAVRRLSAARVELRLRRRGVLATAACLVLPLAVLPSITQADTPPGIDGPIRGLYAGLEQIMREAKSASFPQRFDTLAPLVEQAFDLQTVLRISVGARWNSMDAQSRNRLLTAYRRFTVATYVANFNAADGTRFRILPSVRASGDDRIIGTELLPASGSPVRIDYVMRDENGAWRAVDILLDGTISRVAVQRSDFRKILASGGSDGLITNLRKKTADLSDGTLNS